MLESKESGIPTNIVDAKTGYWNPLSDNKVDLLKKALTSFFPKGINYKKEILIGQSFTPEDTIIDVKIGQFERDSQKQCKIVIDLSKLSNLKKITIFNDETTIMMADSLDSTPVITADANYIFEEVITDFTLKSGIISFTFFLPEDISFWLNNGYKFTFEASGRGYWTTEQYYINDTVNTFYPQSYESRPYLDCSDFCSFLWQIQKNIVIKNKLFTCADLIAGTKEFIESSKLVLSDKKIVNYTTIEEMLIDSESGDIFVIKQESGYHALFLIDSKNNEYTECSGYVEYFLGPEYNGTINPYQLKTRLLDLSNRAEIYRVRLV